MVLAAALASLLAQTSGPVERLDTFLRTAKGFRAELEIEFVGMAARAQATFVRQGDAQAYRLRFQPSATDGATPVDQEFRQSRAGSLWFDRLSKTYSDSGPSGGMTGPPQQADGLALYGFPRFLVGGLKPLAEQGGWKVVDRDEGGVETAQTGSPASLQLTAKIGPDGKPLWFESISQSPNGTLTIRSTVKSLEIARQPDADFDLALPEGYVPDRVWPVARQAPVGETLPLPSVTDARSGRETPLKGRAFVLLVTSEECEASRAGESAWRELAQACAGWRAPLIEVVLDTERPDLAKRDLARQVCVDRGSALERLLGVTSTPLILAVRADGTLERGWQGYADGEGPAIVSEIGRAFAPVKR